MPLNQCNLKGNGNAVIDGLIRNQMNIYTFDIQVEQLISVRVNTESSCCWC